MSPVTPELLASLLERHAAALELFARQWCDCAEDVVQEAFLKLAAQECLPEDPAAWLFRVVRNGAISAARSEQRRKQREALHGRRRRLARSGMQQGPWFIATDKSSLDIEAATEALAALPPEQRETIVAHLWGGLTFEQIAQLTGCSSSTAHRRYVAGLSNLRERLGVSCPDEKTEKC